ncbi:VOC family protein [Variovorax ginsengisoli]|uniref:VOC family protein n=1 Tax=Variovorax ginsengisoli TaxID=363844 RepID=A0ABT8S3X6_9BURK|nr:VOC family protein [Variovorax ginsengisoli]MDN8614452.1 VOC family protein [Variovorax ginsengisoli]MDO1533622.1 VOC family protein [Variovorax ginsengisoli]
MAIQTLAHYSVRTTRLEASRHFYVDVLGFREGFRPPFDFPGLWLYKGDDEAQFGVVHIIGIDPDAPQGLIEYLGDKSEASLHGSAAIDHLAFLATDLPDMRRRLQQAGLGFRERTVPSIGLHQLFVEDPSGVTIELNYPAEEAREHGAHA